MGSLTLAHKLNYREAVLELNASDDRCTMSWKCTEDDDSNKKVSFFEEEEEPEQEKKVASSKKRKRRSANSEPIEGFDVFKSSKKARGKGKEEENTKNEVLENPNKELNRRMEQDALARKQYNIHVSGSNIPPPLKSFAELSSSSLLSELDREDQGPALKCAPETSEPVILANASDVSHFGNFQRSSVKEFVVFVGRTVASRNQRQSVQHEEYKVHAYNSKLPLRGGIHGRSLPCSKCLFSSQSGPR